MPKLIKLGSSAKEAIREGIDETARAIGITLGAVGKTVIISNGQQMNPTVTDDGVTAARNINFRDPFKNMGAQLIREVATKTNDEAGDGTTTSIVLAQKLIEECFKLTNQDSSRVYEVKSEIERASKVVIGKLTKMATQVSATSTDEIAKIATISSLDPEVGRLIAESISEVGVNGIITIEESAKPGLRKDIVKGMRFDKGFVSQYMITNQERQEAQLDEPYILLLDKKLATNAQLVPLLNMLLADGSINLLVIAEDIEGEALATFIVNHMRQTFKGVAVRAPKYGEIRKGMMQDLAVLTGATVISEEAGFKMSDIKLEHLGRAQKVIVTKEHTTIVLGRGDAESIKARVDLLYKQLDESESDYDKAMLRERIANLDGGISLISVGASTQTEMRARKYKIEDALNATRAALQEGVVIGGGAALAKIAKELESKHAVLIGNQILSKALLAPLIQMADNAGLNVYKVIEEVQNSGADMGYDFKMGKLVNLKESSVLDPVKVTRLALENAISIAAQLLTVETIIVEEPEKEQQNANVQQ